jgi:choline dehydrogenase-like flavoprotein
MGPLTLPGAIEVVAFKNTENREESPDVGIVFSTASLASDRYGLKTSMRLKDDIYNFVYRPLEYVANDQWTSYIVLLKPKSKGYLRLKSKNPFNWPKIYTNSLMEDEDVAKIIKGIKEAITLSQSKAFAKYGIRMHRIPLPNCEKHDFGSDIYWECAVRTMASSFHQQTGTCKMGGNSDPTAVVSSNLTVWGVDNLRVIDESVIPMATSGDTVTIAYMIGEKGADLIKGKYE